MTNGITYPDKGANGDNLLRESEIVVRSKPTIYSLRVDLEEGCRVKVVFPLADDPDNSWSFFRYCGVLVGWRFASVKGDAGNEVHFWAESPGHADLPAYFVGHNAVEIKIFENGDANHVRIKTISW